MIPEAVCAGKTTLMDVLAGRKTGGHWPGHWQMQLLHVDGSAGLVCLELLNSEILHLRQQVVCGNQCVALSLTSFLSLPLYVCSNAVPSPTFKASDLYGLCHPQGVSLRETSASMASPRCKKPSRAFQAMWSRQVCKDASDGICCLSCCVCDCSDA